MLVVITALVCVDLDDEQNILFLSKHFYDDNNYGHNYLFVHLFVPLI